MQAVSECIRSKVLVCIPLSLYNYVTISCIVNVIIRLILHIFIKSMSVIIVVLYHTNY